MFEVFALSSVKKNLCRSRAHTNHLHCKTSLARKQSRTMEMDTLIIILQIIILMQSAYREKTKDFLSRLLLSTFQTLANK